MLPAKLNAVWDFARALAETDLLPKHWPGIVAILAFGLETFFKVFCSS